jgi:hypothetical protein
MSFQRSQHAQPYRVTEAEIALLAHIERIKAESEVMVRFNWADKVLSRLVEDPNQNCKTQNRKTRTEAVRRKLRKLKRLFQAPSIESICEMGLQSFHSLPERIEIRIKEVNFVLQEGRTWGPRETRSQASPLRLPLQPVGSSNQRKRRERTNDTPTPDDARQTIKKNSHNTRHRVHANDTSLNFRPQLPPIVS